MPGNKRLQIKIYDSSTPSGPCGKAFIVVFRNSNSWYNQEKDGDG
jgi:hypothetical protein